MFTPKMNLKNLQCSKFYSAGEDSILTKYLGIYNLAPKAIFFFFFFVNHLSGLTKEWQVFIKKNYLILNSMC